MWLKNCKLSQEAPFGFEPGNKTFTWFLCPDTSLKENTVDLDPSFAVGWRSHVQSLRRCEARREFSEYKHFHTSAPGQAPVWALLLRNAVWTGMSATGSWQVRTNIILLPYVFLGSYKGNHTHFLKLTCWIFPHTPQTTPSENKFQNTYMTLMYSIFHQYYGGSWRSQAVCIYL